AVSPAGTTVYTVTGLNASGCVNTKTVQLVVNLSPLVGASASPSSSVCLGGTLNLIGSGAATYSWIPNNQTGAIVNITPLVSTNYTVIGTSALGCTATAVQAVAVIANPTIGASANPAAICVGASAALTATGGTTYTWNPGASTSNPFNVSPVINTTYTVVGSVAGCTSNAVVSLVVNALPNLTVTATPTAICPGGISNIASSGATSYTVNPGALLGANVAVSPAGTTVYTVTGLNASGCVNTKTVQLVVNPLPSVGATTNSATICFGGSAILTGTGASTYTWLPMGTTGTTISVSPAVTTNYTVIGASALSCTNQSNITINVTPLPSLTVTTNPAAICPGASATLLATGATSYSWNTGSTLASITVTTPSTYTVIGTTGLCSSSQTINVAALPGVTLSATANPTAICPSGISTCSVTGGVSYTWSTGSNANNISVSPASTTIYSITGANGFGCTGTTTVQVLVNPSPVITASTALGVICAGNSTTLSASGASTYTWNPGNLNTALITVSPAASTVYTVIGTSSLGCTASNTVAVTVNPNPTVGATAAPAVICVGNSAVLTATGAVAYTWNPGSLAGASQTVSPLITTIYTVSGTSLGCTSTNTVQVTVNTNPVLTAASNPTAVCLGASATLSVTGAISYTWQPGALSGSNVVVTPASTIIYTVTGVNASGCSSTRTVQVIVNPVPSVSVSPSNFTICAGGFVNLTASGASVYSWTPGSLISPTISASPLITTIYTVTGGNAFGCLGQANATVNVQALPVVNITASSTLICPGSSATLTGIGATFYSWSTGSTNTTIVVSPTATTTYSLIGSNGLCTSTAVAVTVSLNAAPSLSISGNTTICAGSSASLTASGAANYTWNPGALNTAVVVLNPVITTAYTLTGANAFGCTSNQFLNVVVNPTPNIIASASSPTVCFGSSTSLSVTGATSYTWNPGNITGANITVTPAINTIYTVSANNIFGCNSQTTVAVTVQTLPIVSASASPTAICLGGSSTLTAIGASSFVWSNSVALASIIVSPTVTTTYSVAGVVGTCTSNIATVSVVVNSLPSLSITANPTVLCSGGTATLTAGGAASYTWSPGASNATTIAVTPVSTSVYTLDGLNAFGCSSTQTLNIVVNINPTINITSTVSAVCAGSCATITAIGAGSYTWMPGNIVSNSAAVCPTITTNYTVTGSTLGCTGTNNQNITVNALPVITATATPASICNGFSSTLTASGAISYSWITIPASGSSVVVSPTINTSYVVSGTNAAGCANTQTVSVSVNGIPSITITSSSNTICVGSTATLTGSGTLSYTWNPSGPNTSTFAVSPIATTVYTLTGSNGAGCTSNQFFTLVVVPIPTVVASASSATVCEGFTTNLIGTGANTYTWLPGGATGSLIVVTPTVNTTYTLSGDVSGCSSTNTVSIIVNSLPTITANASPSIICNGDASTITANGALTFTWIPGLSTGPTLTVNPSTTSIYTVVGLNAAGCPNFASLTLTVLPTPTVSAGATSTAICIGSSATLTGNGAISYTWNPGNLTGTSTVVSPIVATVYTVTGSNGACSTSNTISIVVNALPIVTANSSPTVACAGSAVSFTANGANTYTWLPINTNGSITSANPTITTVYTVTGTDVNGCNNTANISVSVNPLPILSLNASPLATICSGASATLSANGAISYTWSPMNVFTQSITVSPNVNTTYSAAGIDANGCIGNATIIVSVVSIPTIVVSPLNASICAGFNTTLTANGANSYTWLPTNGNGSTAVVNPTITSTYTIVGDNGGNCPATVTVSVFVNPLPANVTATCSGVISCSSQVVTIGGASSNTNVSYSWNGPGSFTSASQSPTVNVWGNYTLSVSDINTGCTQTVIVNVPTDNSIPSVTATASGTISCAAPNVTLTAAHTTTNAGYLWTGPSTFSSILQSFTTNAIGVYTVKVTDLTSGCIGTKTISVTSHTRVLISATITPATCSLGVSLNNGIIALNNFTALDKFDLVQAASYTGSATYTNATLIPTSGIVTSNLANPTNTVSYTIRLFDTFGCFKDTNLKLVPVDCVPKVLGLAKAVKSNSLNSDGTYSVKYKLTVKNYDSAPLSNVAVTENLVNTFPAPTSFTIVSAPMITSSGSSLTLNSLFDGKTQLGITTASASSLPANKIDTIEFIVKVNANSIFGPFNNRIVGTALTSNSVAIRDTSNNGLNPDPDADLNPTNNSLVTPVLFTPKVYFGLSKQGEVTRLANNTFDVSYTITVHNLGNDTLRNVAVKDSLFALTVKSPAKYTMKNGPIAGGQLIANTAFDGKTSCNLLNANNSKMAPKTLSDISFTINVVPDSINGSILKNSAYGNALARISSSSVILVSDTSNSGLYPDLDLNGVCNESTDNIPTVLILPSTFSHTLFIPEGFSPNGDGINDVFVINGLPNNSDNTITVFNRWGNRVYFHSNYNNLWDGYPNIAGTLGKDKLPQGTYYFVLEFKGTNQKPITGFIVLDY
ncbi:MAG: gliding motility-associated C-terminal domain-containing protein, partial [Bacteroidota bacterium]